MSIYARCMQLTVGEENVPLPGGRATTATTSGSWPGASCAQDGDEFPGQTAQDAWETAMAEYGLSVNIPRMKADLSKLRHRV